MKKKKYLRSNDAEMSPYRVNGLKHLSILFKLLKHWENVCTKNFQRVLTIVEKYNFKFPSESDLRNVLKKISKLKKFLNFIIDSRKLLWLSAEANSLVQRTYKNELFSGRERNWKLFRLYELVKKIQKGFRSKHSSNSFYAWLVRKPFHGSHDNFTGNILIVRVFLSAQKRQSYK